MSTSYSIARSLHRQPEFSRLDKSTGLFFFTAILLSSLFLAGAILYISAHIKVVRLGYQINQEIERKQRLIEENKKLRLTIAQWVAPTQIEAEAQKKLGLLPPAPGQILYLSKMNEQSLAWVLAHQSQRVSTSPKIAAATQPSSKKTLAKGSAKKQATVAKQSTAKTKGTSLSKSSKRNASPRLAQKTKKTGSVASATRTTRANPSQISGLKQKQKIALKTPKARDRLPAVLVDPVP